MNRNLTLIISAVVVVVLLAIWLYLMFFSGNKEPEVIEETGTYTEFDSLTGDELDPSTIGAGGDELNEYGKVQNENGEYVWPVLRQLTSRNVIGYQEIEQASTTKVIFAESGVGHIYSIDLETGEEERVSVTTIPDARQAVFSHDGKYVAVKTGNDTGINEISIGEINYDENTVNLTSVDEQVSDFTITSDDYLLYASVANNSVVVRSRALGSANDKVVFTTPFREAKILFGESSTDSHYFQPKTSYLLEGFVYEVDGSGKFNRLEVDGFGLNAMNVGSSIVATYREQSNIFTEIFDVTTNETKQVNPPLVPTKCVESNESIYCAVPGNKKLRYDSITRWLQGVDSYADNLWHINGKFEELINITEFSGRSVDVINGGVGHLTDDWYFQNKTDNSLWVYELSRLTDAMEDNDSTEENI